MPLDAEATEFVRRGFADLLEGGSFGTGSNVLAFEEEFAAYNSTRRAVAVASGSAALELLVRLLGRAGATVLVPANTNFATLMAVDRAGLRPKLVDVDPEVLAPSLQNLRDASDPTVVGVMFVHMGGIVSPSIDDIADWCREQSLWLVEDCAHAHGSHLDGRRAGTFGVAGAYSFFKSKMVAAGEGGMIVTDDESLAEEASLHRSLGKQPGARNIHVRTGTNARMTELGALVGRAEMLSLDERVARRHAAHLTYVREAESVPGLRMLATKEGDNGYRAPAYLDEHIDRDQARAACAESGIDLANEIYPVPLHRQPIYPAISSETPPLPGAELSCERQICLPLTNATTTDDATATMASVAEALARWT